MSVSRLEGPSQLRSRSVWALLSIRFWFGRDLQGTVEQVHSYREAGAETSPKHQKSKQKLRGLPEMRILGRYWERPPSSLYVQTVFIAQLLYMRDPFPQSVHCCSKSYVYGNNCDSEQPRARWRAAFVCRQLEFKGDGNKPYTSRWRFTGTEVIWE